MATTEQRLRDVQTPIRFSVNGRCASVSTSPSQRLSRVLREDLGLTGTKVGCDAGDCGACTVLLDGEPVCACLVAAAQAEGCEITTVEGLAQRGPLYDKLQKSFLTHGAAQCGACTPGMLIAATALLEKNRAPTENEVMDAIGGVLCRCTGYRKIITAVLDVEGGGSLRATPDAGQAVGNRLVRLDGQGKVTGVEVYGADEIPVGALMIRVVRCPFHRARFRFGDLNAYVAENPGVSAVLTAKDVPGENRYGGNNLPIPRATAENAPDGIHYFTLAGRGGFLQQCSGGDQHSRCAGAALSRAVGEKRFLQLVIERAALRQTFDVRDLAPFYLSCGNQAGAYWFAI